MFVENQRVVYASSTGLYQRAKTINFNFYSQNKNIQGPYLDPDIQGTVQIGKVKSVKLKPFMLVLNAAVIFRFFIFLLEVLTF